MSLPSAAHKDEIHLPNYIFDKGHFIADFSPAEQRSKRMYRIGKNATQVH